jgi:hypothetical protein
MEALIDTSLATKAISITHTYIIAKKLTEYSKKWLKK